MHAVLVTVDIAAGRGDETEKLLHEGTIPRAKSLAGFQRGVWMRSSDKSTGRGVMLFDTEENATAAVTAVEQGQPPDAPVKIRSVETFEVMAEA